MGQGGTSMKKPIGLLLLVLSMPVAANERGYGVSDFDRVRVLGPFIVEVETGKASTARASGSADALDRVTLSVQGRQLTIRQNSSAWGGTPGKVPMPAKIHLTTRLLNTATLEGTGGITITQMRGPRIALILQGPGALIVANIEADRLDVNAVGAGQLKLGGNAKQMFVGGRGSVSLMADTLTATDLDLTWQSAGNASVGAMRKAKIVSAGAGLVTITGTPACTVNAVGAGEVICGDRH
jgi:hypothetical protein